MTAIQSGAVLGYQALAAGLLDADPRASWRTRTRSARGCQGDPHRRAVGGALGRGLEGVDAIDPDLTLKGLAILHAEVGGGEPLALGLS